jgi:hypothetical protein
MKTCVKCDLQLDDYDEYVLINDEPVCFECEESIDIKRRLQLIKAKAKMNNWSSVLECGDIYFLIRNLELMQEKLEAKA